MSGGSASLCVAIIFVDDAAGDGSLKQRQMLISFGQQHINQSHPVTAVLTVVKIAAMMRQPAVLLSSTVVWRSFIVLDRVCCWLRPPALLRRIIISYPRGTVVQALGVHESGTGVC